MSSTKELAIEAIRHLPDQCTIRDIVERVAGLEPAQDWGAATSDAADPSELEWRLLVTRMWEESLNDPREDIYTLEDGVPNDEPI